MVTAVMVPLTRGYEPGPFKIRRRPRNGAKYESETMSASSRLGEGCRRSQYLLTFVTGQHGGVSVLRPLPTPHKYKQIYMECLSDRDCVGVADGMQSVAEI